MDENNGIIVIVTSLEESVIDSEMNQIAKEKSVFVKYDESRKIRIGWII